MSETTKKALIGAGLAVLLALFVLHVREQRARRAPVSSSAPAAPAGAAGASPAATGATQSFSQVPLPVVAVPVRAARLTLEAEALGNARANESVDVTAKVSNLVTAVRFDEGQHVRSGHVLVELDSVARRRRSWRLPKRPSPKARASSSAAASSTRPTHCPRRSSTRSKRRSRRTRRGSPWRGRARSDTIIRAPFAGRVGLRRVSVGSLVNPGTVITTLDDTSTIKLDFTVPEMLSGLGRAGPRDRRAQRGVPGRSPSPARWRASTPASTRLRAR